MSIFACLFALPSPRRGVLVIDGHTDQRAEHEVIILRVRRRELMGLERREQIGRDQLHGAVGSVSLPELHTPRLDRDALLLVPTIKLAGDVDDVVVEVDVRPQQAQNLRLPHARVEGHAEISR
jgi:hypothetical protein